MGVIEEGLFDRKCWWCHSENLTREHVYKKSDVKREHFSRKNETDTSLPKLILLKDGLSSGKIIQGPDSKLIKFDANLCKECNNDRSQAFDLSYDKFIIFLKRYEENNSYGGIVNLEDIYGDSWEVETPNLSKYFIKHLGCTLSENNFKVPRQLIKYLDGVDEFLTLGVEMTIYQNVGRHRHLKLCNELGILETWLGRSDIEKCYSSSTGEIHYIHYRLQYRSFDFYIKLTSTVGCLEGSTFNNYFSIKPYIDESFEKPNRRLEQQLKHQNQDLNNKAASFKSVLILCGIFLFIMAYLLMLMYFLFWLFF